MRYGKVLVRIKKYFFKNNFFIGKKIIQFFSKIEKKIYLNNLLGNTHIV